MASWSNTKNVGSLSGKLRVVVDLVSQSGNSSVVDVTGILINDNNSGTASGSNVPWNISGAVSKPSSNFSFSVAAKRSFTIGTHRGTITHNADGTKTATVSLYVGATGTSTFGTPGTVSVTFTLPRIPKPPSAPGAPTFSQITASSVRAAWTAPTNNMGAAITDYRLRYSKNSNMSGYSETGSGTGRAATATGLSADTVYYFAVIARNSAGWGSVSATRSVRTTPLVPNAVSGVTRTRVSDSAQDLKWQNNPVAGKPYGNVEVLRLDNIDQTKVLLARLAGNVSSYRDSSTVPGRRYDYYLVPKNAGGRGPESGPHGINTTPPAAMNVVAVKRGQNIEVTWERKAVQYGVMNYEVWDNPGGTGWGLVATIGDLDTWTHVAPNASVTHQYRVRVSTIIYSAGDVNRLWSADSKPSAVVQLLAPPLVPTIIGPVGAHDRDAVINFQWRHNAVDTTEQEAATIRYRVNGGAWVTYNVGADQNLPIPALGISASLEWQVQTKGEYPSFGPWSALQSFGLGALPTVSINAPADGPYPESRVQLAWGYFQPDGVPQAAWQAWLVDDTGATVETKTGTGTASSTTFARTLIDGDAYTVWVAVTAANGLKASEQVSIIADFPLPVTTVPVVTFDEATGGNIVTLADLPEPGPDETMPDFIDIRRRIGNGPWIMLAVGLSPDDAVSDPLPHLTEPNFYQAISRTALPTEAIGQETEFLLTPDEWTSTPIYVNGGPGYSMVCHVIGNASDDNPEVGVAHHQFVGDDYPTAFFDQYSAQTVTFGGPLILDSSKPDQWHALLQQRNTVCLRDRLGRRIFGTLGITLPHANGFTSVAGSVFRTNFREEEYWLSPEPETGP